MSRKAKDAANDLEARALGTLDGIRSWADNNSRILIFGALGLAVAQWAGWVSLGIPDWWPLAAGIVVSAAGAAYVGADKVSALIPEEEGIWLIAFQADGKGGEIWEIHEDDWADMSVDGTLYEWSESPRRLYECREYDADANHAVANWRESKPGSALARGESVEDALAAIRELRKDLEPEAAKHRELRRRLRGIVRQLDRQRAEQLNRAIDEATVDKDMGEATISDVLEDSLPDDLHPHAGGGVDDEQTNGHAESEHWRDEPMVDLSETDLDSDPLRPHND